MVASFLILINKTNPKNNLYKVLILFSGLIFLIFSELNSEFISLRLLKNMVWMFLPLLFLISSYLLISNLNKKII